LSKSLQGSPSVGPLAAAVVVVNGSVVVAGGGIGDGGGDITGVGVEVVTGFGVDGAVASGGDADGERDSSMPTSSPPMA